MKKALTLALLIISFQSFSQSLTITGMVQDTSAKAPLQNAVAMAVRMKDSTLVSFIRTDKNGFFKLSITPIDTYQVIISHAGMGDKFFYVLGSKEENAFDFGKFSLPAKSISLKQVVIYAHKDPIYYNGDTLVYVADSFKTKANATVEDLLKKLPGIQVNAQGKITANGKAVDQVLVDGDEFFGADPTIATRNLNANNVQSVQIYDKPKENSAAAGGDDEPTKVMNLKLKDDAKKGYFGKVSGAGDFNKFYEGEALVNKFRNKQKISAFGLTSNTPNSTIGWSDAYKYGLEGEMNSYSDEDGSTYYSSNDNSRSDGLPSVTKAGIYYADRYGSKTKITANYSYKSQEVQKETETNSQYFLTDTTYRTMNQTGSYRKQEKHSMNADVTQTLDSLTDLKVGIKFGYMPETNNSHTLNDFITDSDSLSRRTITDNNNKSDAYNFAGILGLSHRFKKKDRVFNINYKYSLNSVTSEGILRSQDYLYGTELISDINQKKNTTNNDYNNLIAADYMEPITKKLSLQFSYQLSFDVNDQNRQTLDFANGEYSKMDSLLSNRFESKKNMNRLGTAIIYETKKQRFNFGAAVRKVDWDNTNQVNGQRIDESVTNVLPYFYYSYSFTQNRRLNFRYSTSSSQPTINQLQPVPDNTNPNYIVLGNPNLVPTYSHRFSAYYNSYKAITGSYSFIQAEFSTTNNDISNSLRYDSAGRTITQPVNVNGDYNASAYFSNSIPFFSRVLEVNPSANFYQSSNSNYINGVKNTTRNTSANASLGIRIKKDNFEYALNGTYSYHVPFSTIGNIDDKPYYSQYYNSSLDIDLPKKFKFATDADYTLNQRRALGYNTHYFIWGASLSRNFLKKENLIVSVAIRDILNQNVNISRTVQDNIITDTRTNSVGRYFLFKVVYKFNSNKEKAKNDDEY